MLARSVCALVPLLGACADARVDVAWPALAPSELGFLLEVREGLLLAPLGPFAPSGPAPKLELDGVDELYLVAVETAGLAGLHPRIDVARLSALRLVDEPVDCASRDGVCRAASNELLYVGAAGRARTSRLEGDRFVPRDVGPASKLWLELPARWGCRVLEPAAVERIDRWSYGALHKRIELVHEQLIALGGTARLVGASPPRTLEAGEDRIFVAVAALPPDRAFLASASVDGEPGSLLEVAVGAARLEPVREIPLPFPVMDVIRDERGLVAVGLDGSVATSTDGVRFTSTVLDLRPDAKTIARLGVSSAPHLIGAGSGSLLRGDAWAPRGHWTAERLGELSVDSSVIEFLETRAEGRRQLWARTAERGFYLEREPGRWSPLDVDVAGDFTRCKLRTNPCGFGEPPPRTGHAAAIGDAVYFGAEDCPLLLAASDALGCASFVDLSAEAAGSALGVAARDGELFIVVADGVLRVRAAELF